MFHVRELDDILYNDSESKDFCIVVEKKAIMVHKAVLCARSPVFQAMLKMNSIESRDNRMFITDFTYATVEAAIYAFYYCGCDIKNLDVMELLRFADKYDVSDIKAFLGSEMIYNIQPCNVVSFYNASVTFNIPEIVNKCLEFIRDTIKEAGSSGCIPGITEQLLWAAFNIPVADHANRQRLANQIVLQPPLFFSPPPASFSRGRGGFLFLRSDRPFMPPLNRLN